MDAVIDLPVRFTVQVSNAYTFGVNPDDLRWYLQTNHAHGSHVNGCRILGDVGAMGNVDEKDDGPRGGGWKAGSEGR